MRDIAALERDPISFATYCPDESNIFKGHATIQVKEVYPLYPPLSLLSIFLPHFCKIHGHHFSYILKHTQGLYEGIMVHIKIQNNFCYFIHFAVGLHVQYFAGRRNSNPRGCGRSFLTSKIKRI